MTKGKAMSIIDQLKHKPLVWMCADRYTAKPADLYAATGIRDAHGTSYWGSWTKDLYEPGAVLDEERLISWARRARYGDVVFADDWHRDEIEPDTFLRICEILKAENPLYGIYSFLPRPDWYAPQHLSANPEYVRYFRDRFWDWRRDNTELFHWAEHVNAVFPGMYIPDQRPYVDEDWIRTWAVQTLVAGRRYGKPIIPFIWCRQHFNGRKMKIEDLEWVTMDRWEALLLTIREMADGVVWWDGVKMPWSELTATPHWRLFCEIFDLKG